MQYLEDLQTYEDRYDLMTVRHCLEHEKIMQKVFSEMNKAKELNNLSDSEKTNQFDMLFSRYMTSIIIQEYKQKEKTISEWLARDRARQNLEESTPTPKNILCNECGAKMKDTLHHLHTEMDKSDRVIFFFDCTKCNFRKAVFDNGEEWKHKSDLCKKCGTELSRDFKIKGNIETWTTKCSNCNFKEIKKSNCKEEEKKRNKEKQTDKDLLSKYRVRYCLSKEKAEEIINALEELAFSNEVFEYELQKYVDPGYEQNLNLNKLSIIELEATLNKVFKNKEYERLKLKDPDFGQFVEVEFTTQDFNARRDKTESVRELTKLIVDSLQSTNWRLHPKDVAYRLGYLTGRLRGYEREEDILNLLVKRDKKPKKELDTEKWKKYEHSNAVKLAKLSAEYEGERRIRLKQYKNEPEGFVLETHGGSNYTCNLCNQVIKGNETWWLPEAILCFDCNRNLKAGVFPIEIFGNRKLHFHTWDLEHEFGLHSATIRKFVRNGELVTRDLKDLKGKTYYSLYMAEDNINFFKSHKRVREREKRWHFVDKKGKIVWL